MVLARAPRTLALLTALWASACGGATVQSASPAGSADATELAELEALYYARADSARLAVHEADVAFMQGMIGHHAQALVMSELAPDRAGSSSLRTLAARTISSQDDEIESMRGWLEERGQVVPEVHVSGVELTIHGGAGHDHTSMPGMLSPEQMRELEAARGANFDRLFLTYMIEHHRGAVAMVHQLFDTDGAALDDAVFAIASNIQVDQISEIRRMESMLANMTGGL